MKNSRFQFRTSTLLLLAIPAAVLACVLAASIKGRPGTWTQYDQTELEYRVRQGRTVVLFVKADWNLTSVTSEKMTFDDEQINHRLRSWDFILMNADITRSSSNYPSILWNRGIRTAPVIAIFSGKDLTNPTILEGVIRPEDLHQRLDTLKAGESAG